MKFNLEEQFKIYLERGGIQDPSVLSEIQYTETKRAFFGACGQILVMLRDEISPLPEEEGIEVLDDLVKQVSKFWEDQVKKEDQN